MRNLILSTAKTDQKVLTIYTILDIKTYLIIQEVQILPLNISESLVNVDVHAVTSKGKARVEVSHVTLTPAKERISIKPKLENRNRET